MLDKFNGNHKVKKLVKDKKRRNQPIPLKIPSSHKYHSKSRK
jgi:hypothetical protein